ncbi:MAG: response regulator [Gammaproteobacteria bacterium]|nr:response regulator [Gammaproteobacteria bacterium]
MAENETVLVVDDDPSLVAVQSAYLQSFGYQTVAAENGHQALDILKEQCLPIDIIISDVMMPGMGGYELCQTIKNDKVIKDIPFLFVSSHISLEEKIKGYGVGGDDYINKPVIPEELNFKLKMLLEAKDKKKMLQNQLAESHNAAMQAMTYSADLGQILEFYKNTLNANNFEELSAFLFEVTNSFGLHCTLQITALEKILNLSTNKGEVSPLESNVIELSRTKGRFFDFGTRTVINYKDFSLLIKNMPINDPERYGILKDTLSTLCHAIEARTKVILSNKAAQHNEVILSTVQEMLAEVKQMFNKVQTSNIATIEKMSDQIEEAMLTSLGLSEEQEASIRTIVRACLTDTNQVYEKSTVLTKKFEGIRAQLESFLSMKM